MRNSFDLSKEIKQQMCDFRKNINSVKSSIIQFIQKAFIGTAPCQFCLLDTGSPSVTLYSDFEYVILYSSVNDSKMEQNICEVIFLNIIYNLIKD